MNKVKGKFSYSKEGLPRLTVKVSDEQYKSLREHIKKNMFISYKRPASMFRRVILNSVGDHLNEYEQQNYIKADVYLEIVCPDPISDDMNHKLIEHENWIVQVHSNEDEKKFQFAITKDNDQIIDRVDL